MLGLRYYCPDDVLTAARRRIAWVFREFGDAVVVSTSGGKDSTVVTHLALAEAEKAGRLPLKVLFIDQEAEWDSTIAQIRAIMADPRVEPHWLQCPIRLTNATSTRDEWLFCWQDGKEAEWIRPKEPTSIHRNTFGTDRFKKMFGAWIDTTFGTERACYLSGVRTEESPARLRGLTTSEVWKGETWGSKVGRPGHVTFYPIYDWSLSDVWKAIHAHGWPYNRLYDRMYQYGIPLREMRVSNVHHETATRSLWFLQEFEPHTWDRITARLHGVNTAGHLRSQMFAPKDLPPMFKDWKEYRDHLLDTLIAEDKKPVFRRLFRRFARAIALTPHLRPQLLRAEIDSILANDYEGTKLNNFQAAQMTTRKTLLKIPEGERGAAEATA